MSLVVSRGRGPLVLVAPHGGRRDPARRPWGSAPCRMNDLHTASLTQELAAALNASALVNDALDRNDVDLNRLSAAHDRQPAFLDALASLLDDACARHGRATVVTVHGWNVVEPRVDVGLGCRPGAAPLAVTPDAAVSPAFAAHGIAALVDACAACGIHATIGARYPACARENLVQLFTPRHRADPRPRVRRLAALGASCDAFQLELGIPLRWPGAWRRRFVDACRAALPALAAAPSSARAPREAAGVPAPPARTAIEIAGADVAGLAAIDGTGSRLLLCTADGGLLLFTGDHAGRADAGGLAVVTRDGATRVRFAGPLARFPDTTPFVDLEEGLARATLVDDAALALDFVAAHADDEGGAFGAVTGALRVGDVETPIAAHGFAAPAAAPTPWPRLRATLRLGDRAALALVVATAEARASGFVWDGSRRVAVAGATARLGSDAAPLDGLGLDVRLADGSGLHVDAEPVHRLPVVRGGSVPAVRVLWAACRVAGSRHAAGWCELGGY